MIDVEDGVVRAKRLAETPVTARRKTDEEAAPLRLNMKCTGGNEAASSILSRIGHLRGSGAPLPGSERAFFEPRFGRDFAGVRVHAGKTAADLAASIHAKAFTLGNDVAFGKGEFRPGTAEGRRLLGHELTHVAQQGALKPDRPDTTNGPIGNSGMQAGGAVNKGIFTPFGRPCSFLQAEMKVQCGLFDQLFEPEQAVISPAPEPPEPEVEPRYVPYEIVASEPDFDFRRDDPLLFELLDESGPRGWHTFNNLFSELLPLCGTRGSYTLRTEEEIEARRNNLLSQLYEAVTEAREEARASIHPFEFRRPPEHPHGMVYTSSRQAIWESAQGYDAILTPAESRELRTRYLWIAFAYVLTGEGDSSSIQSWDQQNITWGHGFAASGGNLGRILNALPIESRVYLHLGGIHVYPDNSIGILVNRGRNRIVNYRDLNHDAIRQDEGIMSILISLGQSATRVESSEGGRMVEREERQLVLREQFLRFLDINRDISERDIVSLHARSRDDILFTTILMKHWLGNTDQRRLLRCNSMENIRADMVLQFPSRASDINGRAGTQRGRINDALARASGALTDFDLDFRRGSGGR